MGLGSARGPGPAPRGQPGGLKGIELNHYAAELARVTIWIGQIQWMLQNGFAYERDPILRPLDAIRSVDAVLDLSNPDHPTEPEWPEAEFIVGNPPFLGSRLFRRRLGDEYVDALFRLYDGRVTQEADFVTYWFEKAREMVVAGTVKRAGLLATQGIRGGANRRALERIKESGDIFMAISDREWILEGAAVHVSFIAFDNGTETERLLDDVPVVSINADLTSGLDLTAARPLRENEGIAFQGPVKIGPFDIRGDLARRMLAAPNPDGRSNADVVRPWVNGRDIGGRPRGMWIVDFGEMPEDEAALYEAPFEYVRAHVRPIRETNRRERRRRLWWQHGETVPGFRAAMVGLSRYIATPRVSRHRVFVWVPAETLPDSAVVGIAKDDDFTFGVLHSSVHEAWARRVGTQLRERESGFRYTPRTTFEPFPFPEPTDDQRRAVANAAAELVKYRDGWLRAVEGRTLTELYNDPPAWLSHQHDRLDAAVLGAYGWPDVSEEELLRRLLELNAERTLARV